MNILKQICLFSTKGWYVCHLPPWSYIPILVFSDGQISLFHHQSYKKNNIALGTRFIFLCLLWIFPFILLFSLCLLVPVFYFWFRLRYYCRENKKLHKESRIHLIIAFRPPLKSLWFCNISLGGVINTYPCTAFELEML